ncbi:YbhB/YbcL family Raf kinase inhibitor-like protein [Nocardia vinacea]|uniref:YbhB/YbcL family Raf kinase inhibitor-like protein n=1 Tax=Nocardia vinacea TaxID=96468 RepID=UPI0034284AD2
MSPGPSPYDRLPQVPSFPVRSNDITDGKTLAAPFRSGILRGGGQDRSPHLAWEGFPGETKSFAVTCYDPDAPIVSGFWHWAVFNIPPSVTELASGAGDPPDGPGLPTGSVVLPNDAGLTHYLGAAPPPGTGEHRYFFVVHAVGVDRLELADTATPAALGAHLRRHTLARGHIVPVYENNG